MRNATRMLLTAGVTAIATGLVLVALDDAPSSRVATDADRAEGAQELARLEQELALRDEQLRSANVDRTMLGARVEELEGLIALLEAELERRTRSAADIATEALESSESLAAATQVAGASPAAVARLRELLPDELGDVTAAELAHLRELDLRGMEVSDADLAYVAELTNLRELGLRGTQVTDAGLMQLGGLWQLESLDLRGTEVDGSGLHGLPANLARLDLTGTQVSEESITSLMALPNLASVDLNGLGFGDHGVELLGNLTRLRKLELDQTPVTGEGLRRLLSRNPDLERVEVRNTAITPEEAAELRRAYPHLTVVLAESRGFY